MKPEKRIRSKIPRFKSLEEEAEFWETHSTTEFEDEFVEVKRVKVSHPLTHTLAVRLDARTIDRLAEVGRKKGVGPSTLARMWLLERLEREAES